MATVSAIDYRRTDQRITTLMNPYWITSGLVDATAAEDKYALLFSFPTAGKVTMVLDVVCQIVVGLTAGSTIDIGYCTLATDDVTTGGVGTTVDDDDYIKQDDITVATPAYYRSVTAHVSDWLSMLLLGSGVVAPLHITGAASTVPCIMALTARGAGAISAGSFRVHMLITEYPGVL